MKRPMVWFVVFYITGILLSHLHLYAQLLGWIMIISITFVLYKTYYWKGIIVLPLICFFAFINLSISTMSYEKAVNIIDKDSHYAEVEGTIKSINYADNKVKAIIKPDNIVIDDIEHKIDYAVMTYWESNKIYEIGDKVRVKGTLSKPKLPRNPGQFNQAQYYRNRKIAFSLFGDSILCIGKSRDVISQAMSACVKELNDVYDYVLPAKQAGILKAMILGEREYLDEEIKDLYKDAGIAHILAISGLHVSIIGYGLYQFLKSIISIRKASLISIGFLILYCFITGASISTVRAVTMLIVILMANVIGRTYDVYSSLSFAALLLLIINPFNLSDVGFILSFMAVLSIVTFMPLLQKLNKWDSSILPLLFVSLSVFIGTLPVVAFYYYEINIYSILINVIIVPLMPVVIAMGLIVGITGVFSVLIAKVCAGVVFYLLNFIDLCCEVSNGLPFSKLVVGQPSWLMIFVYYGLILLSIIYIYKRKDNPLLKRIYWTGVSILLFIVIATRLLPKPLEAIHLDVGQGDSAIVLSPSQNVYLIDGGGKTFSKDDSNTGEEVIDPFLESRGIHTIDCMILTHSDYDHICGLLEILEKYKTRKIIVPATYQKDRNELFEELVHIASDKEIPMIYMEKGQSITDKGLTFYCLNPNKEGTYSNNNGHSLVFKMTYGDFDMILTGDIEYQQEDAIAKTYDKHLNCEMIKVPHHGSNTSSTESLLQVVNPECGVVSVGKDNSYGHPSKEVIDRYHNYGTILYNTADDGAVNIRSNGSAYIVSTYVTKRKEAYQCKD